MLGFVWNSKFTKGMEKRTNTNWILVFIDRLIGDSERIKYILLFYKF